MLLTCSLGPRAEACLGSHDLVARGTLGAGQPWWMDLVWFPPLTPGRRARPRPALFRRDSVRSQYFRVPPPWGQKPSVPLGLEGLVGSHFHTTCRWTVSWWRSRTAVCLLCPGRLALRARVSGDAVTSR